MRPWCSCGIPGPVSVTLTAKWPLTAFGATRTSPVGELDGVADQIEQYLGEALFITEAKGQGLRDISAENKLLVLGKRLGGRAYSFNHALDRVLGHVQSELAGLDLGDVEDGVDQAQEVLTVGTDAGERVNRFLAEWFVETLLHELGITQDGGEGSSQLVAHVGDELGLVLACDLQVLDSFGK